MSDSFDRVDEARADLRAEGVAVGGTKRTLLASIATYAPVAYAGAVVLRDADHPFALRIALAVGALYGVRRLTPSVDELPSPARGAARIALVFGAVAAVLASGLGVDPAAITDERARAVGVASITCVVSAAIASAAALFAAESIAGLGGLAQVRPPPRRGWTALVAAVWITAGALEAIALRVAVVTRSRASSFERPTLLLDALAIVASIVFLATARRRRRHELGASERHDLLLGTATLALPAAIVVASRLHPAVRVPAPPVGLVTPALAVVVGALVAQLSKDPVASASYVARAWIAFVIALVGWVAIEAWSPGERELRTGLLLVATLTFGILVGAITPAIARRLGLLDPNAEAIRAALARAREANGAADLREAERGTLGALRLLAGPPESGSAARPFLITFAPLREVFLDAAGEPRARDPVLPPALADVDLDLSRGDPDAPSPIARVIPRALLDLVKNEPLGVVRVEVLRALEIRRPDLRPALAYCDRHDAAAIVGLMLDGDLEGLLALPRGRELLDVGLVHARALRTIARLVAPRIALETALGRAAARTRKAEERAREVDHVLERAADRQRRIARALAAAASPAADAIETGGYAPTSRAIRAEIDAHATAPTHLAFVHRPGTDPTAYAARLHLASRRGGALHVVDASRTHGIDPARWNDPVASPIELARDGTLLVRAAHLLPLDAQRAILRALAFRVSTGNDPTPVDLRVVLSFPVDDPLRDDLARVKEAIDPALFARLHPSPVRIPRLADRAEDLRALALDRLASIGVAMRGAPLGLSDEALAILIEHPWPGDDDELAAVLLVAAERAKGVRIEAADVRAVIRMP